MLNKIVSIEISKLRVSPFNVRKTIGDLTDLKESIKSVGLLQPIVVRPIEDYYEVVIGQRRFLACKELGFKEIPAIIKHLSDKEALELSLIENIQMETLDPIERAEGVKALVDIYEKELGSKTKALEIVAEKIGKSVRTIRTWLDVLKSTEIVKQMVKEKKIDLRTAAAISKIEPKKQEELVRYIIDKDLSGQEVQHIVTEIKKRPEEPVKKVVDKVTEELEEYFVTISMPGKLYVPLLDYSKRHKITLAEAVRRAIARFLNIKWP